MISFNSQFHGSQGWRWRLNLVMTCENFLTVLNLKDINCVIRDFQENRTVLFT